MDNASLRTLVLIVGHLNLCTGHTFESTVLVSRRNVKPEFNRVMPCLTYASGINTYTYATGTKISGGSDHNTIVTGPEIIDDTSSPKFASSSITLTTSGGAGT